MDQPSPPSTGAPQEQRVRRKRRMTAFVRGLATLLPAVLTIFVFLTVINFVKTYVVGPINDVIYWTLEDNSVGWKLLRRMGIDPYDEEYVARSDELPADLYALFVSEGQNGPAFRRELRAHRAEHEGFFRDKDELLIDGEELRSAVTEVVHPLIGLLLSLLLVIWMGWLVGGFLGRKLFHRIEHYLGRIPGISSVYPYTKRFVEFFLSENELEFDTVVAMPYPSQGVWSVGFVTSASMKTLREATGLELVSIFVPSSPMPMTGYTVHMEARKLIPLPISVDEALRVTVSGGVLIPPNEFAGEVPDALRAAADEESDDGKPVIDLVQERIARSTEDSEGKEGSKEAS